jgi:hypothetical protein
MGKLTRRLWINLPLLFERYALKKRNQEAGNVGDGHDVRAPVGYSLRRANTFTTNTRQVILQPII